MDDSFVIPIPPFEAFSSTEFEKAVASMLSAQPETVKNFQVEHLANEDGVDGAYEVDVLVTYQFAGMNFKVLIECKNHGRPVQRDMVQVLHSRVQSVGAQKGVIFSTHGFQSGAIKFAEVHGIALVRVCRGNAAYETRSLGPSKAVPEGLPEYVAYSYFTNGEGGLRSRFISIGDSWLP